MDRPSRVLLVEDSETDAKLVVQALRKVNAAVETKRVEDAESMRAALEQSQWDVVLSDWSMPKFGALAALKVLQDSGKDLPFIIVSGTIGEEAAVDAMRAGAHDYVLKDKLGRLGAAVEREFRQSKAREARRFAEKALSESEIRFKRLFDCGIIGIIVSDTSGVVSEANDAFLKMVGHDRVALEAGQINARAMTPPEWRSASDMAHEQLCANGCAPPFEQEYVRKDRSRVSVLVVAASLYGAYTLTILVEQTERRRLEAQLRQSQKMEAIGSLAGGVAHDFNNLLSIILSYADLLITDTKAEDPILADLTEIKAAGLRAAGLTRQLLAFSRKQRLEPKIIDLNNVAGGMSNMLRRIIGEHVELTVALHEVPAKVHADPGQVEQVIMNLVVNARDSMPNGGKLTIEVDEAELDAEYAARHVGVSPGRYVMLAISDTGEGMSPDVQSRIFDPFFTTKEPGKGTGLGLSTVFGIIKQSKGSIWVYSEVGVGTTFKIYLPQSDPHTPLDTIARSAATIIPGGNETILLAEDDDGVRPLVRNILTRQGYHVLEAPTGADALRISEQYQSAIHLLLTDIVMPRISGRELADRLLPQRPEMKVLYMSGYTENGIVQHGVLDASVAFIQKPITPETLGLKIRALLGPTAVRTPAGSE
jgi:two-component system cell cycle sensor histidine kinase/response regulator CckA